MKVLASSAWVLAFLLLTIIGMHLRADAAQVDMSLVEQSGCLDCHSLDKKVVGPSFHDIAAVYKDNADARTNLIQKVTKGGKGNWTKVTGGVLMPPHSPRLSDARIEELVDWVLHRSAQLKAATEPSDHPLAKSSGCLECHSLNKKVIGPSFLDISRAYEDDRLARADLIKKVRYGGKGKWTKSTGGVLMPPHSGFLSDVQIEHLVDWVLQSSAADVDARKAIPADVLAKRSGCLECHSADKKVIGPSYQDISEFYKSNADARAALIAKVKNGGKGNWTKVTGGVLMPPHSAILSDAQVEELVDWVLRR